MKKALLSTTALIAGGLIAGSVMAADLEPAPLPAPVDEGFTVEVGGTAFGGFFYIDNGAGSGALPGSAIADQTAVPWLSEIWFTATTTLANGIQVGVRVELEGVTIGDQIDEHYIWVSGNFGRFVIGAEDGSSDLLAILGPGYGALGLDGPSFTAVAPAAATVNGAPDGARKDMTGDSNKVSYFTPRISGFQAGVSFTPAATCGGGAQICLQGAANTEKNVVAAAANYINTFNNVSVAFGAGVETGKNVGGGRRTIWNVGARLGFAGFTVGGNYSRDKDNNPAAPFTTKDRVWQISASYGTGPWTVGGGYLNSKRTSNGAKYTRFGGGATYALGTGVTLTADVNREKRTSAAGVSRTGTIAGVGILTSF